ncbi:Oxidoreductase [Hyphomicrobiales bacterium]|nr:Oxidoreductase [Hyphomicrobiales bacterium]CAH1693187.1 Oxidoreductase [Hyphomicrobiales bacterium]
MTSEVFDVVVIGGGLHGLSAGLHLARQGARVIVLERAWTGRHASGATAAGVRTLGRDLEELPISLEAMRMWHDIEALVGDDCGFSPSGHLKVAETPEEFRKLEEGVANLNRLGYCHEIMIGQGELRRIVPALAHHCVGASYSPDNGAADPHRTLLAFRTAAERAGVTIHQRSGVDAITPSARGWTVGAGGASYSSAAVVNAAGAWGGRIARLVGDEFPLGTRASMMTVSERVAPFLTPTVGAVSTKGSFKQTARGTVLIGGGFQGGQDLDAETTPTQFANLAQMARNLIKLFPAMRDVKIVRTWGGLEGLTKDRLPYICPSPSVEGVFHVFGFSGHGFQLAPVVGAIVADLVLRGQTLRDIKHFNPRRFARTAAA